MARHAVEAIRRAFKEFLTIPSVVIGGFLLLAIGTYFLDRARIGHHVPISAGLFSDAQAARAFLGVIATSIITVTSITFSLLLVAVQQGAAALTPLVFDQFLRRRTNQIYFGFFIGLALYSLAVLSTVNQGHQPIYGVALGGVMTVVALYMLILLIYTTIDQMRPVVILQAIHDHTLAARERQVLLLRGSRRAPRLQNAVAGRVTADRHGFLTRLDLGAIAKAARETGGDTEVVIAVSVGDFVAFGDTVAEIRTAPRCDVAALHQVVQTAIALEEQRDLDADPAFGIEQLVTIGWTSISTAKSNPRPGLLACWSLRDLLARWLATDAQFGEKGDAAAEPDSPVVYVDNVPMELMKAFESFVVVASESLQHQSAAEVYRTFTMVFDRLPPSLRQSAEGVIMRSLSALGEHVLTSELDAALASLATALSAAGRPAPANAVRAARGQLETSIGRLNSRSTRAEAAGEKFR